MSSARRGNAPATAGGFFSGGLFTGGFFSGGFFSGGFFSGGFFWGGFLSVGRVGFGSVRGGFWSVGRLVGSGWRRGGCFSVPLGLDFCGSALASFFSSFLSSRGAICGRRAKMVPPAIPRITRPTTKPLQPRPPPRRRS